MYLVALVVDAIARARIASALHDARGGLRFCTTLAELRKYVGSDRPRLLLLQPIDAEGHRTAAIVREVRNARLPIVVVAYHDPTRDASDELVPLMTAGTDALLIRGVDDERNLLRLSLRAAEQRNAVRHVRTALDERLGAGARPLVALYLDHITEPFSVADAARALGVHRKTLLNRMQGAGCPAPAELRAWCRLLVVTALLEQGDQTVEGAATQLDFTSGTAFRNMLKRHTGMAPHELRAAGGLLYLLGRFEAICSSMRPAEAPAMASSRSGPCLGCTDDNHDSSAGERHTLQPGSSAESHAPLATADDPNVTASPATIAAGQDVNGATGLPSESSLPAVARPSTPGPPVRETTVPLARHDDGPPPRDEAPPARLRVAEGGLAPRPRLLYHAAC